MPANPNDFCSIADVKASLNIDTNASPDRPAPARDDSMLSRLVTSASVMMLNLMNRSTLNPVSVLERRNGNGAARMVLYNDPVIAVQSVGIDTVVVPASPDGVRTGWVNDRFSVMLTGGCFGGFSIFRPGFQNVALAYQYGFGGFPTEAFTVGSAPMQVAHFDGFVSDLGVSYAGGPALVKVSATPAIGQYSVDPANGLYAFSGADAGAQVSISYSYKAIPFDVSQAAIELAAQKYRRRTHIDQDSQSMQGQNISFSKKDIPPEVMTTILNYKRRAFIE